MFTFWKHIKRDKLLEFLKEATDEAGDIAAGATQHLTEGVGGFLSGFLSLLGKLALTVFMIMADSTIGGPRGSSR